MWLRLVEVLGPAHGNQRGLLETFADHGHRIGDQERIAVDEHEQIVGRSHLRDLHRQVVQLARVRAVLVENAIEVNPV